MTRRILISEPVGGVPSYRWLEIGYRLRVNNGEFSWICDSPSHVQQPVPTGRSAHEAFMSAKAMGWDVYPGQLEQGI